MTDKMNAVELFELEEKLQYRFKDARLMAEALRHSSFVNESADPALTDNERLEFLGDAVLNLTVGHLLMRRFPDVDEGDLSRMRANLVNETQLAELARSIDLGSFLKLGKGEIQSEGGQKNSILADAFEAVIAAIYLDGSFEATFTLVENFFDKFLDEALYASGNQDYKSQVQELAQSRHKTIPIYQVVDEQGPDHDKTFCVSLKVLSLETTGFGKSKKIAEQQAAQKAFVQLKADE
jgi:ribonuclease III